MSGVKAPQTAGAFGALLWYFQQLHPGLPAYGIDAGVQVADTSTGGTARVSTLTAWGGAVQNGTSGTWTQSSAQTIAWVSTNSTIGSPPGVPQGGADDAARAGALASAAAQLTDKLIAALGGVV